MIPCLTVRRSYWVQYAFVSWLASRIASHNGFSLSLKAEYNGAISGSLSCARLIASIDQIGWRGSSTCKARMPAVSVAVVSGVQTPHRLQGCRDNVSAFSCFFPARCSTVKLNSFKISSHLLCCPIGSGVLLSHCKTA